MSPRGLSDRGVVVAAVAAAIGAQMADPTRVALVALGVLAVTARHRHRPGAAAAAVAAIAAVAASVLAVRSLEGLRPRTEGSWAGTATLLSDPVSGLGSVQADVRVEGKHLLADARGAAEQRLSARHAGERVRVHGVVHAAVDARAGWMLARHIAGRIDITAIDGWTLGTPLARVANTARASLLRSAVVMPADRRALFAGFILGDARGESPDTNDDFKAAGLTHLLVVSGQNVAFTLAAFEPVLRQLPRRWRLRSALMILLVFAAMTRFEPSVLRASAMATIVLVAAYLGRPQSPLRVLALAVLGLLLVDPLLVHSVGFGLSVGACAGIALLDAPLRAALPGPAWLRAPLATTLSAQAGTMILLVPIFGSVPLASVPANLLALPAAEPVMGWGVAAGLPAGFLGRGASTLVHIPTSALLWWVAGVAHRVGALPLGGLSSVEVVVLAVLGLAVLLLRRAGAARRWRTMVGVGAVAVVVAPAVLALHVPALAGAPIAPSAALWRPAGWGAGHAGDVLVLDVRADAAKVLAGLRSHHVEAVDLVVVRTGGRPQGAVLDALGRRIAVGAVLAGDRAFTGHVRPALDAEAGMVVRAGRHRVTVTATDHGRLRITVDRHDQGATGPTLRPGSAPWRAAASGVEASPGRGPPASSG